MSFSWDLEIYYLLLRHNNIYVTYKIISSHKAINQTFNLQTAMLGLRAWGASRCLAKLIELLSRTGNGWGGLTTVAEARVPWQTVALALCGDLR